MTTTNNYSEDALVEQPAIALFASLGWQTVNAYSEALGSGGTLGRETRQDVVLRSRLLAALTRLNPELTAEALELAAEEMTRDRSAMIPVNANQEVYSLLKDGVKVVYQDEGGAQVSATVRVIAWNAPADNDFLLVSQLWVTGDVYTRRADLIGFVNGIPLVFLELKASHKQLKDAYNHNLRDYKNSLPQLWWYNAFILLSNGSESRVGSLTAAWEHFAEWKKINAEGEEGVVSLETVIRGTCAPERLLDIVENFILYSAESGGLVKLVAKNHQYLGVNRAVDAVRHVGENGGRLGVFWHTQGSGKSYSMVFFAQKVLRRLPGNYTFLVVTDRQELDQQIYQTFARAGAVMEGEEQVRAGSGDDLQTLLREDHRYLFTLIQKFHTENGAAYPALSQRADIIVMTDEAHRSQYDVFAQNMRTALPQAAFIGFTGTPLMAGEEKTRSVFGEYVSVYDFQQSVTDGATVPLYYENRIPELQLTNADLNDDMAELLDDAVLDEAQERKLEREFGREYHLLTREDRLDTIAADIVTHFLGRGYAGKAMVISVDKLTAARMYHKVRAEWNSRLSALRTKLLMVPETERTELESDIAFMTETDMALVVSQSQNEVSDMKARGIDILPHRLRMQREDLATKFKKAEDPLRIVFVCAMWITGFDVPSCSTIYLDKPMKNHTLMQTIARANRVYEGKQSGLIVDYAGVFRNLQRALAIYAAGGEGGSADGSPVADKAQLVAELRALIDKSTAFCTGIGIQVHEIQLAQGFERVRQMDDAVELLIAPQERKREFLSLASAIDLTFRAILPDAAASEFGPARALFSALSDKISGTGGEVDISDVLADVDRLLDESVAAEGYVIRERPPGYKLYDLSRIDFDKMKAKFAQGHKHTEAQKLQAMIKRHLTAMVALNKSRMDFLEKFQAMIDEYNSGSSNVEAHYQTLLNFAEGLSAEDSRALAERLTEEELAIYDLLTRPQVTLTAQEVKDVNAVAQELLETLKRKKLVLDWRKKPQSRARVRLTVEEMLDKLPPAFSTELYLGKCEQVYQHIYDSYAGDGRSIYAASA